MDVNRNLGAYLTVAGVIKNGQPDRAWFETSCARSNAAIAFAKAEIDRELAEIIAGAERGT